MKKLHLFLFGLILSFASFSQSDDPVVLTVEGQDIPASEFLYIYSKNNENPSFHPDSLDSYMELFINYKLKVREAKEQKYDTIPRLINELSQYRKQLSLPYMTNKEKNEALIEQAYERTETEVRASHILVRMNQNPSPADTNAAYIRCMQLRNRITNGESFESVATSKGGSDDPSVIKNKGDLGYFSALQMVYPFEQAAFSTPVGEVSMPVRTRFGYHLIKVTDKRKARGMIETAHILILVDAKAGGEEEQKAEEKINEIYALLEGGERFEDLAAKYSDDQTSKTKGGLLPLFGSGAKQRMVPAFEEAAFALENDGEYTKPVRTMFGWHIIKRIQIIPTPAYDQMYRELKLRVERDMRAETTKQAFIEDLKKEYNYTDNAQKLLPMFYTTIGDEIFLGKWRGLDTDAHDDDVLFSFKNNMATVKDFEEYIITRQTKMRRTNVETYVKSLYDQMVNEYIVRYEDSVLEQKHPEFKSLIQEYADGILVFEIMQNEIWRKASKDSAGIRNYYESHRADFTYPVRYKGQLYTCKDKATANAIVKLVEGGKLTSQEVVQTVNKDSQLNAKVKSQIFNSETTDAFKVRKPMKNIDKPELPKGADDAAKAAYEKEMAAYNKKVAKAKAKYSKYKMKTFNKGINKPYKSENLYYVMNVEEIHEPRNREFDEAKGLVTAAYQNQLEKEWLAELRKKYSIKVHTENLHSLKAE